MQTDSGIPSMFAGTVALYYFMFFMPLTLSLGYEVDR